MDDYFLFHTVAHSRTLREAGKKFGIGGRWVGMRIKQIEEIVGAKLIQTQSGNGASLRLTEAGAALKEMIEQPFNDLTPVQERMEKIVRDSIMKAAEVRDDIREKQKQSDDQEPVNLPAGINWPS